MYENQQFFSKLLLSLYENQHFFSKLLLSMYENQHFFSKLLLSLYENQHFFFKHLWYKDTWLTCWETLDVYQAIRHPIQSTRLPAMPGKLSHATHAHQASEFWLYQKIAWWLFNEAWQSRQLNGMCGNQDQVRFTLEDIGPSLSIKSN